MEEEARARAETAIMAYGIPLVPVTSFKNLGRILTAAENGWPAVVSNLRKERRKWAQLIRVLGREGEDAPTLGQIYLSVIHLVLFYGS